ncbi:hypothetical protein ACFFGT_04660 [Mucilaginibacter angelicae]|uniref:Alpha 1,2-mannosyltransferase n=1 Tax=Mucilaginibacter angelicae TaxID=869718 RepID=A0ABV6L1E8_9SPHI
MRISDLFQRGPVRNRFTEDFYRENNCRLSGRRIRKMRNDWIAYASSIPPYPNVYSGRGIVICAGGYMYVTCAWINISMLRKSGCSLPVELWHEGGEINESMKMKFKELGVICKDCKDYSQDSLKGYAMKPFSILNSSFKEVLFLDADNNCVKDPTYLFDSKEYLKSGTIFWPDAWTTPDSNPIWKIIGCKSDNSKEQESGQILIDKEKCWKELNLCIYFNENRELYYKFLLGDKDTFKFAWMALKKEYYMISTPLSYAGYTTSNMDFYGMTMVQHDDNGEPVFLHRNLLKWGQMKNDEMLWTTIRKINGDNVRFKPITLKSGNSVINMVSIEGEIECMSFRELFGDYELNCLQVLKELRSCKSYLDFLTHIILYQTRRTSMEDLSQSFERGAYLIA